MLAIRSNRNRQRLSGKNIFIFKLKNVSANVVKSQSRWYVGRNFLIYVKSCCLSEPLSPTAVQILFLSRFDRDTECLPEVGVFLPEPVDDGDAVDE